MGVWQSIRGSCRVTITSADPVGLLRYISDSGVRLSSVYHIDEITVQASLSLQDIKIFDRIVETRGASYRVTQRIGAAWRFRGLLSRPVLLIGLFMYFLIVAYLPGRVLFVQVEGNSTIPTNLILEKAALCGIRFGADRKSVRSEEMKNNLLAALPELKWAGVNTSGCVAVISVGERSDNEEKLGSKGVSSIIAKMDCVIQDMTVIRGNPVCVPGQAVKAGQLLVSGYTDCGITVKAEVADAEIFGLTMHRIAVKAPEISDYREDVLQQRAIISVKIGKKLIKLSKCSGISDGGCVKMYEEKYIVLPGGFQLPISFIKETVQDYNKIQSTDCSFDWVGPETERYLHRHMTAGRILQRTVIDAMEDGYYYYYGNFACLELVGQVHSEEILTGNGKRD